MSLSRSPSTMLEKLYSDLQELHNQKEHLLRDMESNHLPESVTKKIKISDIEIKKLAKKIFRRSDIEIFSKEKVARLKLLLSLLREKDFPSFFRINRLINIRGGELPALLEFERSEKNKNDVDHLEKINIAVIEQEIKGILTKSNEPFGAYGDDVVELILAHLDNSDTFWEANLVLGALGVDLSDALKEKLIEKLISLLSLSQDRNVTHQAVTEKELVVCITLAKLGSLNQLISEDYQNKIIALPLDAITYNIINAKVTTMRNLAFTALGLLGATLSPSCREKCINAMLEVMEDKYDREEFKKIILKSLKQMINSMSPSERVCCIEHLKTINTIPATIFLGHFLMVTPEAIHHNPYMLFQAPSQQAVKMEREMKSSPSKSSSCAIL